MFIGELTAKDLVIWASVLSASFCLARGMTRIYVIRAL